MKARQPRFCRVRFVATKIKPRMPLFFDRTVGLLFPRAISNERKVVEN